MIKDKKKRQRKPGGGRRQLIEGVELKKVTLRLPQAQIDHLESKGEKGNVSDGARKIIAHNMAEELERERAHGN